MSGARKDKDGRVLYKGESQRASDQRYVYTYQDPLGRRKFVYARDLKTLREKEKQLKRDQLDGLDLYIQGKATINDTFDRYIANKYDLRDSTRSGYIYTYDHFVRDVFGKKLIVEIRYSDVLSFYYYLLNEKGIAIGTLDSVHCILHPTFQLAVRDDIIRKNPTDGVMKEIAKKSGKSRTIRHALTEDQQKLFMEYIAEHAVYCHWWPLFAVLLGTGLRIGECLGLTWKDLDFEKRLISVNHALAYYPTDGSKTSSLHITEPKTEAGIRIVPMIDTVYQAFLMTKDEQKQVGACKAEIDGYKGFVFQNRFGNVHNPQTVNRTIKRIIHDCNYDEQLAAKKEHREPVVIPNFSCHHLRHTFATRLCQAESNLKIIQEVMGHNNIETTMDIYAEATEKSIRKSFEGLSDKLDNLF